MITGVTNPRMKQVAAWQQKARERRRDKVFLAEGVKMFLEAPPDWIMEVYLTEALFEKQKANQAFKDRLKAVGYELVSEEVFSRISDTQTPQGILCVLRQPEYELSDLLKGENPLLIVLENLQDPGNVGTVLRTAAALGIDRLCLCGCAELYHPRVVRAAMGALFRQRIDLCTDAAAYLHSLRRAGYVPLAAMPRADGLRLGTDALPPAVVFAVGNEGHGLSAAAAQACCGAVQIPMTPGSESLNAAAAAALLIWETVRQEEHI